MSDVEALMWNLEKDPVLSSAFATLTIMDRPPDLDRLRARMAHVVSVVPRLRQRVVPSLGRLAPPEWRDDPDLDLDYHVRRVALPEGSTLADLRDLAALFVQAPFDRTRPLWEFAVIEGLPDGRGALVQKMHHTITDGEGGVRMSERMVDLTRDAEDPPPVAVPPDEPQDRDLIELSLATVGHGARRVGGIATRTLGWATDTAVHPERWWQEGNDATQLLRSASRQLLVADGPHSPLWATRTLRRRFEVLDVPFADAKAAAEALGGSLNDFFVAGAAWAAGAYHRQAGVEVADLRMAMPVSFRTDRSAGGNAFAPMRVVIPTGGADRAQHFAAVRERLTTTKSERAIGLIGAVAGLVNVLPTSVLVRFVRQQTGAIDFTTSNVRAAPFDLYIAGGLLEANYPLGPLSGTACNLTMMSYRGMLNMGLHVDTGAVTDPERLREDLVDSYAELVDSAP